MQATDDVKIKTPGGNVRFPIYNEYIKCEITICLRVPRRETKSDIEMMLKNVIKPKKGDVDNYAKAILDGMNGIVYEDDSQVTHLSVKKRYASANYAIVEIDIDSEQDVYLV